MSKSMKLAAVVGAALAFAGANVFADNDNDNERDDDGDALIQTLSARKNYVSGGDVLVRLNLPRKVGLSDVTIRANGRDVTSAFAADPEGVVVGLVTGLPVGKSTISVRGKRDNDIEDSVTVTNYPITGPIISGPHDQPFICQTAQFMMPNGTTLGPPIDADCSIAPRADYVYRSTANAWKPLVTSATLPADVARTTTTKGANVPFVVRIETRTVNRGVYQSAILHDPTTEGAPSAVSPPKAWNQRLVAIHGYGCTGGWYLQGAAQGSLAAPAPAEFLDANRLGQGYAVFTNTLQHPSNSCNGLMGAETAMMSKERFIESYGRPRFTVSHGCSGGSYTSSRYTDIVPGLFDGVLISCTFPDPLAIALNALDGHLLTHYFYATSPGSFSDAEIVAITGAKGVRNFTDLANQAGRMDPVPNRVDFTGYRSAVWNPAVPASMRYHPVTNPRGYRPTVGDWERNINGVDPATGFALSPYDNVGVQYGLQALNSGALTKAKFLELNERIGGYDHDVNYVAQRSVGNAGAIKRLYQSGIQMSGAGGLASIPIMDVSGIYNDDGGYHYQVFHFAARERLAEMNGNANNYIMWRGSPVPYQAAWDTLVDWVERYTSDTSGGSQRRLMLKNKPASAVDGCFDSTGTFIAERQTLGSAPNSTCNTLFPSWTLTRIAAGGPVSMSTMKCKLKPIDRDDYTVAFTREEMARLRAVFPNGVCDWSKAGVNQVPIVPLASVGPAPQNRIDGK
jgi:hypothetical protein